MPLQRNQSQRAACRLDQHKRNLLGRPHAPGKLAEHLLGKENRLDNATCTSVHLNFATTIATVDYASLVRALLLLLWACPPVRMCVVNRFVGAIAGTTEKGISLSWKRERTETVKQFRPLEDG